MQKAARTNIPKFSYEYLSGGIGRNQSVKNNRKALDNIIITPQYLVDNADDPDCRCELLGQKFDRPFGVAPIGLSGLIWPGGSQALAHAARNNNIPFCLSGFATVSMEEIAAIAGEHAWYQHYMCSDDEINKRFFKRALDCGYQNLIITIDIPTATRRDHDIRNGLSVPPRFNFRTAYQILQRPRWALETLTTGIPRFENFIDLLPDKPSSQKTGFYLQELIEGHVNLDRLKMVRDHWPHNLIIKGILSEQDAQKCVEIGVEAIVVSNHGGRQLDAADSAIHRISQIRQVTGNNLTIIADGGVLTGLDIIRYMTCGADFVLAGRAFMYGVAAMGQRGAEHVMKVLFEEFECTMAQIGCNNIRGLSAFRADNKTLCQPAH